MVMILALSFRPISWKASPHCQAWESPMTTIDVFPSGSPMTQLSRMTNSVTWVLSMQP